VPGEDHENFFHRSAFAVFVEAILIGIGANTHMEPYWVVATFGTVFFTEMVGDKALFTISALVARLLPGG
jgi:hypothetical protein